MEIKHRIELVKLLPANSVVAEIGVAEGNFSKDLLDAGVDRLFMVDYWGHIPGVTGDGNFHQDWHDMNYYIASSKVQPYGWRAKLLRGMSVDMADSVPDNSLDMIYLDAAHYYSGVVDDLLAWFQKVKNGGIIAGHDYLCKDYDVEEAVKFFVRVYCPKAEIKVIPENNENDASFYFVKP